jgi:hypothetical protein
VRAAAQAMTAAAGPAPAAKAAPTIAGTPATATWEGDLYTFQPVATDADGDPLQFEIDNRPSWALFNAATGRLSGTPQTNDVGLYPGISIRVTDGTSTASLPVFDLNVDAASHGSVTVTWNPPTENIDDSPLQDLTGFNVYWGTSVLAKRATAPIGTTSYVVENLAPGAYQFATTAVNTLGIESEMSDLATIVVR